VANRFSRQQAGITNTRNFKEKSFGNSQLGFGIYLGLVIWELAFGAKYLKFLGSPE
jgi:hypothetical protein